MFEIKSADGSQTIYINPANCAVIIPSALAPGDGKCRIITGLLTIEVTADIAQQVVASQGEAIRGVDTVLAH
jgi:hypothetical protein